MLEFLNFVDDLRRNFPIHIEIYYSKIMDWCIVIYKKGCAQDYPGTLIHDKDDALLCNVSDPDKELCFAKAHVAVKEWLLKYLGGS